MNQTIGASQPLLLIGVECKKFEKILAPNTNKKEQKNTGK
jgi:hypothetical protein